MKTMTKKLGSILLALCLCFSLCCTAFAASGSVGSITVNGVAGESYSVYKIFDLTYTDDGSGENGSRSSYSYTVTTEWQSFISRYTFSDGTKFELDGNGCLTNADTIAALADSEIAQFARDALAYAEAASTYIAPTKTDTATKNEGAEPDPVTGATAGTASFTGLDLGWYLVSSSLGTLCMLDSTDPDQTINEKNAAPSIDKYVMDVTDKDKDGDYVKEGDADVVDTLQYEIVISNAANGENLVVHDRMDTELKYSDGNTINDLKLYVKDEAGDQTEIADSNYQVNLNPEDKCAFEISFEDSFLATLNESDQILIVFTVTVDASGDSFSGDIEEWSNHAFLTYGLDQTTPEAEADTYSYGIEVFKYTGSSEETAEPSEEGEGTWGIYAYLEPGTYYILSVVTVSGNTAASYIHDQADEGSEFEKSEEVSNLYELGTLGVNQQLSRASYVTITEAGTYYFTHEETGSTRYANSSPWYFVPASVAPSIASESTVSAAGVVLAQEGYFTVSEGSEQPLAGAQFVLSYTATDGTVYYAILEQETDFWLLTGWTATESEATRVTTPSDGMIRIEGLAHDVRYTLTEVAAPDGYNMLTGAITVEIVLAQDDEGNDIYSSFEVHYSYNGESGTGVINVLNQAGSELPNTGGIGTTIFYIIGGVLVAGAVVLLVTRRRMNHGE